MHVDTLAISFGWGSIGLLHEKKKTKRMLDTSNYINNTSNISILTCEKHASMSIRFHCGFQAMVIFKIIQCNAVSSKVFICKKFPFR